MLAFTALGWALQAIADSELPAGQESGLLRERCLSCHDLAVITTQRKPLEGWADTLAAMAARGAELSPDETQRLLSYLARHFSCAAAAAPPQDPTCP